MVLFRRQKKDEVSQYGRRSYGVEQKSYSGGEKAPAEPTHAMRIVYEESFIVCSNDDVVVVVVECCSVALLSTRFHPFVCDGLAIEQRKLTCSCTPLPARHCGNRTMT